MSNKAIYSVLGLLLVAYWAWVIWFVRTVLW